MHLTLTTYIAGVRDGSIDPKTAIQTYLEKIKNNDQYNAFVRIHESYVHEHIDDFSLRELAGAPIGIKDIFMTK